MFRWLENQVFIVHIFPPIAGNMIRPVLKFLPLIDNKMKSIFVFFLTLLSFCSDKTSQILAEKEQDLTAFFNAELNRKIPENTIIVTLQNQACNACQREQLMALSKVLKTNSLSKTFILAKPDIFLTKIIKEIPKSDIQIDFSRKMKDYGLDYGTDRFYLFKDGQLYKYFEISNANIRNLKL